MFIYPPDIVRHDRDRPVVVFRNKVTAAENDTHIVFPIPPAIQFSDGASYNPTELDFRGALGLAAARASNVSGAVSNVSGMVGNAIPKSFGALAQLISRAGALGDKLQAASSIGSQITMNKNLVTEFGGVGTRTFSFSFKLVSKSRQETEIIRRIVDTFRLGIYPEGNALQLKFPPTWYINFQKGGVDIPFLPKIFETYLVSLNTTYNSSGNMFHGDGSPVETEIQLSFMESRALTHADMQKLINGPFKEGDFISNVLDGTEELNHELSILEKAQGVAGDATRKAQ